MYPKKYWIRFLGQPFGRILQAGKTTQKMGTQAYAPPEVCNGIVSKA